MGWGKDLANKFLVTNSLCEISIHDKVEISRHCTENYVCIIFWNLARGWVEKPVELTPPADLAWSVGPNIHV